MVVDVASHWFVHLPIWDIAVSITFGLGFFVAARHWPLWGQAATLVSAVLLFGIAAMALVSPLLDWVSPSTFSVQKSMGDMGDAAILFFPIVAAAGDALRHLDETIVSGLVAASLSLIAGVVAIRQARKGTNA